MIPKLYDKNDTEIYKIFQIRIWNLQIKNNTIQLDRVSSNFILSDFLSKSPKIEDWI